MPELIEVELYRSALERCAGRRISAIRTLSPGYLRQAPAELAASALVGRRIVDVERVGKVAVARLDSGDSLGFRFGMTGRVIVDGISPIDRLEYGPAAASEQWDRFALAFDGGGSMRISDPRRFGSVTLNPDLSGLGPDATRISLAQFRIALDSRRPIKGVLLDQERVAGLGNLLVDETLWRGGVHPERPAEGLDAEEVLRLRRTMRSTVRQLTSRGGSHLGDLQVHRSSRGCCPLDGTPLKRLTVAGRTTYLCPEHQR